MDAPRYILVANPGTKRCEAYRGALAAYCTEQGLTPEVEIVPWGEVAACRGDLEGHTAFDRPAIVRLESPGKDPDVYRQFLNVAEPNESVDWRTHEHPKGLILQPGLWYRGFERILQGLHLSFDERPHLRPTARPRDIAVMFDKHATLVRLRKVDVPVPDWQILPVTESREGWPTTYVKLRYGSSASGMIQTGHANTTPGSESGSRSTTTMVEIDGRFFNSRQVQTVRGMDILPAILFLQEEGAIAQQGIPMAQIDGKNFDLRVVCLYGKPAAVIFRLSRHPMTNLHLGGTRGDYGRCREAIPNRYWLDAMEHCEAAAAQFDAAMVGVDLVFERGFKNSFVLEVNAFGDFFPWWADAQGKNLHRLEIEATASRAFA